MNKFNNWLKIRLRKFLEVDNLESELKEHKKQFNNHDKSNCMQYELLQGWVNSTHKDLKNDISHFQESVNVLHNTVENVVHIGTDVVRPEYGHSWAVVCVEGKINIIKFMDLNRNDAREIFDFLKHFEAGRHCIDTPYKEMFYDGLFKF